MHNCVVGERALAVGMRGLATIHPRELKVQQFNSTSWGFNSSTQQVEGSTVQLGKLGAQKPRKNGEKRVEIQQLDRRVEGSTVQLGELKVQQFDWES